MTDPRESEVGACGRREPRPEVPDAPGRGLSPAGFHVMVGVPELANQPSGRVDVRGIGAVVREVAGVENGHRRCCGCPSRCPWTTCWRAWIRRLPREMVPFGLSEITIWARRSSTSPRIRTWSRWAAPSAGRTNFLRAMMRAIMSRYSPDEATIVLIDPRRKLVGVVPEETGCRATPTPLTDIKDRSTAACAQLFEQRLPPPGTSQQDMLTRQFWTGRRIFVVVDDIDVVARSGRTNPLARPGRALSSSRPTSWGCTSSPPPTSSTGAISPAAPGCSAASSGRCRRR